LLQLCTLRRSRQSPGAHPAGRFWVYTAGDDSHCDVGWRARFLGIDDRTGSIAAGKEADLQVVRGAPDRDIRNIDDIEIVFANGVAYDPDTLLSSVKSQVGWR
jgi:hypothetical protein